MPVKNILAPVDSSEESNKAAAFAADLADSLGASLTLLHIIHSEAMEFLGMEALEGEELERARARFGERAFGGATQAIGGREARQEIRLGKPSFEIVRFAREEGIDLIVMGSRGLSGIKELLVGSVSSQVVDHAPCSVTIVR